jgi:FKBP-type peptidyl-prolyl cis-trans isomerase 2
MEYTGFIDQNGEKVVFDTTQESIAKDEGIHAPQMKYGAMPLCLGQGQLIPGLDKQLQGKEIGVEYTIIVPAEDAFGKKDPKMIQLISTSKFRKAEINPVPGLQVNIDNQTGIVKAVSGGRTIVDFNHPLSGKEVTYKVKVNKLIDDSEKQLSILAGAMLQIEEPEVKISDKAGEVFLSFDLPKDVIDVLVKKIKEVMPSLEKINFVKKQDDKATMTTQPKKEDKEEPKKEEQKKE